MNSIAQYLSQYNVQISSEQLEQFRQYMQVLQRANEQVNLTAITDEAGIIEKHFIDSLSILNIVSPKTFGHPISMIDVGAGAGFPGVPLKLLFPNIHLTLVDSVQKKVKFLSEISGVLGLKDTTCIALRAEIVGHDPSLREAFDIAVARAVSETRVLVEYLLPLIKVGGCTVLYKSADCDQEVAAAQGAIKKLGGGNIDIKKFSIGVNGRSLVLIKKIKNTPPEYPRKEGMPSRKPL